MTSFYVVLIGKLAFPFANHCHILSIQLTARTIAEGCVPMKESLAEGLLR